MILYTFTHYSDIVYYMGIYVILYSLYIIYIIYNMHNIILDYKENYLLIWYITVIYYIY